MQGRKARRSGGEKTRGGGEEARGGEAAEAARRGGILVTIELRLGPFLLTQLGVVLFVARLCRRCSPSRCLKLALQIGLNGEKSCLMSRHQFESFGHKSSLESTAKVVRQQRGECKGSVRGETV